jgi:hypothetical protein
LARLSEGWFAIDSDNAVPRKRQTFMVSFQASSNRLMAASSVSVAVGSTHSPGWRDTFTSSEASSVGARSERSASAAASGGASRNR